MKKATVFARLVVMFFLGYGFFSPPVLLAGKIELTTYYPAPYGEYTELKATGNDADNAHHALEARGNSGTGLVVTNANNVGIGTTTPNAKLQIGGSANVMRRPLYVEGDAEADFHTAIFVNASSRYAVGIGGQSTFGSIQSGYSPNDGSLGHNDVPLVLNRVGGNVGIGTSTPDSMLHVAKDSNSRTDMLISNNVAKVYLGAENSPGYGNAFLELKTSGAASSSNTPYIDFSNDYSIDYDIRVILTNNDTLDVQGGALTHTSDSRIKLDQETIPYGLDEIIKLRPKKYMRAQFRNNPDNGQLEVDRTSLYPDIGLVAQEVYEVVPEAAVKPDNENKTAWSLGYDKLTPVLIRAIQEQQEQIEQQQQQIRLLQKQVAELQ